MYAPTEMRQMPRRALKYVYVKMLRAQVDASEGKLVRGDVLVLEEDKAMRWVYRAKIARPATKMEFDDFQNKMRRTNAGSRRLRNQPMTAPPPEENPFEYVDNQTPEFDDAEAEYQDGFADSGVHHSDEANEDSNTLAGQLEAMSGDEASDEDDEGAVDERYDEGFDPNAETPGVYNQSISRGPGERLSPEEDEARAPLSGPGRSRGRRRGR